MFAHRIQRGFRAKNHRPKMLLPASSDVKKSLGKVPLSPTVIKTFLSSKLNRFFMIFE